MQIAGRSGREYAGAAAPALPIVIAGQAASVILRLAGRESTTAQTGLVVLACLVAGWSGWHATRRSGFSLTSAAVTGALLSLGTAWALPVFHTARAVFAFAAINASLFAAIAALGAWLAAAGFPGSSRRTE